MSLKWSDLLSNTWTNTLNSKYCVYMQKFQVMPISWVSLTIQLQGTRLNTSFVCYSSWMNLISLQSFFVKGTSGPKHASKTWSSNCSHIQSYTILWAYTSCPCWMTYLTISDYVDNDLCNEGFCTTAMISLYVIVTKSPSLLVTDGFWPCKYGTTGSVF